MFVTAIFLFLALSVEGTMLFAETGDSKEKSDDLKFVNVLKVFIFFVSVCIFAYFYLLLTFYPLSLLAFYPHPQTQTNTAVAVAYYSGQVRACRWGLLNAGATVHQCLRNRGTCCDHR